MLCITGLPLIFHSEIDAALADDVDALDDLTTRHETSPLLSYDDIVAIALKSRPGEVPLYMSFDHGTTIVNVTTGPTPDAPPALMTFSPYDRASGDAIETPSINAGVMDFILQVHVDLFLGLPGMLFLGFMGCLFIAAIVSGVVLYAPFMRRLDFGTVRIRRSKRLKWLDLHNLLGIVTMTWALVVGFTGVVNTLETPINDIWKNNALADITEDYAGAEVPTTLASLDAAVADAVRHVPDMTLQFVAFPGGEYSTDHHYSIFFHGGSPLTERIITPAFIDARTGEFLGVREMPWYGKGLALSRPLHFGDYGGLPLKVLWAILDILIIVVLVSGIYLWVKRKRWAIPIQDRFRLGTQSS